MDYYNEIKPVLNKLTKFNVFENLSVTREYLLAYGEYGSFQKIKGIDNSQNHIITPSIADFIIANSIKYSPDFTCTNSLKNAKDRFQLLKPLKSLEESIGNKNMENGPFLWLNPFILNQAKQQNLDNIINETYRYFLIFNKEEIREVIEKEINMPYKDYIACSFWLYSIFIEEFCYTKNKLTTFSKDYENTPFTKNNMEKTLFILSKSLKYMRELSRKQIKYTESEIFNFSNAPHLRYPLIEHKNIYYCVSPRYLLNQLASGIYHIANIPKSNVSISFGKSFEDYIGKFTDHYTNKDKYFFSKEILYNRDQNKTSDWIVYDNNYLLFIECKTKRLTAESKTKLSPDYSIIEEIINNNILSTNRKINLYLESFSDSLTKDIINLGIGIGKIYKVYNDYKINKIEKLPCNSNKYFIPLMVTIDEWYAGNPEINQLLNKIAKSYLDSRNINSHIIDEYQYRIMSASTFEIEYQIMMKEGLCNYLNIVANRKMNEYRKTFKSDSYFYDLFYRDFICPIEKTIKQNKV